MDFIKVLIIIMDVMKQCNHFSFFPSTSTKNVPVCIMPLSELKGIRSVNDFHDEPFPALLASEDSTLAKTLRTASQLAKRGGKHSENRRRRLEGDWLNVVAMKTGQTNLSYYCLLNRCQNGTRDDRLIPTVASVYSH